MIATLSVVLLAGLLSAAPQTPPPVPPPLENLSASKIEVRGEVWLLREVTFRIKADGPTISADEAEYRPETDELRLRGKVRASFATRPDMKARGEQRLRAGGVALRGNVRIGLGPNGPFVLADEADYSATTQEIELRGNVRVDNLRKPPVK